MVKMIQYSNDGWSLVENQGRVGYFPNVFLRAYSDLTESPINHLSNELSNKLY